jgi:hypothetical protein
VLLCDKKMLLVGFLEIADESAKYRMIRFVR